MVVSYKWANIIMFAFEWSAWVIFILFLFILFKCKMMNVKCKMQTGSEKLTPVLHLIF